MGRIRALAPAVTALLALVALSCDKSSPVAPDGTVLTISANPIIIPTNGTATITVVGRKPNGLPVTPGTLIRFTTSIGRIEESVPADEQGIARASLRGDGRAGKAKVTASTGPAELVEIEVDIGSPGATISLLASPTNISESGGLVQLQALVRDSQGQPQPQAQVNFVSPVGRLASGGLVVFSDGTGTARDTLTVSASDVQSYGDDVFEITAQVGGGEGALVEDTVEIDIGTPVGSITLSTSPTTLSQNGGTLQLRAVVRSEQGRPIQGARVNYVTEVGTLQSGGSNLFSDANGEVVDTLRVSSAQLGNVTAASFTVTVQATGRDGALKEDTQEIEIARAASVSLQANPATVQDTGGTIQLLAVVRNSAGAAVAGAPVSFGTDLGTLSSGGSITASNNAGEARDTLTVTESELATLPQGGLFQVRVTAGTATDTFDVRVATDRPTADFDFTLLGNFQVFFDNLTTGLQPITYTWSFGDNTTSTQENPTHSYGATGTFVVSLRAVNSLGEDTDIQTVAVTR